MENKEEEEKIWKMLSPRVIQALYSLVRDDGRDNPK
jgi:hypothetical protein